MIVGKWNYSLVKYYLKYVFIDLLLWEIDVNARLGLALHWERLFLARVYKCRQFLSILYWSKQWVKVWGVLRLILYW